MWHRRSERDTDRVLCIDIGSASIGASVVRIGAERTRFLHSVRRPIPLKHERGFSNFMRVMLTTLREVIDGTREQASGASRVVVTFTSPWFVAETRTIKERREENMVFTRKYMDEVIARDVRSFVDSIREDYPHIVNDNVGILDAEVLRIRLNGYDTDMPFGKRIRNVDLSVYVSVTSQSLLDTVDRLVRRELSVGPLESHSFPLVAHHVIRNMYTDRSSYLYVDVGGEVTDITLVRSGVILDTVSFDLGKNTLTRQLADHLHTTADEALSQLSLYLSGRVSDSVKLELDPFVTDLRERWRTAYRTALNTMRDSETLPPTNFVTADPYVVTWFAAFLKAEHDDVRVLNRDILSKFVDVEEGVDPDEFLIMLGIYARLADR